jgi:hypothetical protein
LERGGGMALSPNEAYEKGRNDEKVAESVEHWEKWIDDQLVRKFTALTLTSLKFSYPYIAEFALTTPVKQLLVEKYKKAGWSLRFTHEESDHAVWREGNSYMHLTPLAIEKPKPTKRRRVVCKDPHGFACAVGCSCS